LRKTTIPPFAPLKMFGARPAISHDAAHGRGQHLLPSQEFVAALPEAERARFVSAGRFALRGVRRAQELFTLDPDSDAPLTDGRDNPSA
jgi:hypothetical protein